MNSTGEWLGLGSSRLGQLLVWEWKSESYVLKQQGHIYGLNCLDYSHDGAYIVTAGEDGKVKLWNASSGFSFVTFTEHVGPVTAVLFTGRGAGKVVLSASLDGTVRAHEMLRYKNFRTLTAPSDTPVQFTSLAADASGDVVCAGTLDPFKIYVWALQTGRLLDILAGHEGPIASLAFHGSTLASSSWDGTLKVWNVYQSQCLETMEHGCDVLAVAFRPDGLEMCTATITGNLCFWDVESGEQTAIIEGRGDLSGGRQAGSMRSGKNQDSTRCFTCVMYTADGSCVIAAGRSKYVCLYSVRVKVLVKKYQLSFNRSLDGIVDVTNSRDVVDGIHIDTVQGGGGVGGDSDDDEHRAISVLPGAGAGARARDSGSRSTREELVCSSLRFSPSGREWSVATTQGLQIFSLDTSLQFAPMDLDETVTPQTVHRAISSRNYDRAIAYSLQLGDAVLIRKAVGAVPITSIDVVCRSVDVRLLGDLFRFLADELTFSRHMEFYLRWCHAMLHFFGPYLQSDGGPYQASLRALIRAISGVEREAQSHADDNHYTLEFMLTQLPLLLQQLQEEKEDGDGDGAGGLDILSEEQQEQQEDNEDDGEEIGVGEDRDQTKSRKKKVEEKKKSKDEMVGGKERGGKASGKKRKSAA